VRRIAHMTLRVGNAGWQAGPDGLYTGGMCWCGRPSNRSSKLMTHDRQLPFHIHRSEGYRR
jgi:hypothetical protein